MERDLLKPARKVPRSTLVSTASPILIVEDEADIREIVRGILSDDFQVEEAGTLAQAQKKLDYRDFSMMILDIHLPDGDGIQFLARLRENPRYKDLPVMFLTGHRETAGKVESFKLGAVDYVEKPFSEEELLARVRARVISAGTPKSDSFTHGDLRFDLSAQRLVCVGKGGEEREVSLTPHEFRIIHLLCENADKTFTREELIEKVWGPNIHIFNRTIDTHVSHVRKKLEQAGSTRTIRAVHGVGYRLLETAFRRSRRARRKRAA